MSRQTFFYSMLFILFLTGCFKKEAPFAPEMHPVKNVQSAKIKSQANEKNKIDKGHLTKEQREAIYFAASLEREALKLITKDSYYDKGTLFSALSFIVEADAGIKKIFPSNMDCSRFRSEKKDSKISFYKVCQKPESLAMEVKVLMGGSELEIEFKTTEWASVMGSSVALTNPNVRCQLSIRDKRLQTMSCQNWAYLVTENQLSATEVKLRTFAFDRKNELQFHLKGGFFKDLVENKKIAILVPLNGQIKVIEKEIEVIDDFAEKPKILETKVQDQVLKPIIIGGPNGQKEKVAEESQAHPQNSQGQSEDQSEKQINYESETREEIERKEADEKRREEEIRQNVESDESNGGVPKNNGVPETPNRSR